MPPDCLSTETRYDDKGNEEPSEFEEANATASKYDCQPGAATEVARFTAAQDNPYSMIGMERDHVTAWHAARLLQPRSP